jgi:hypothetical protein
LNIRFCFYGGRKRAQAHQSGKSASVSREEETSADWHRRFEQAVPDQDVWLYPEPWRTELEASWELLFDPTLGIRGWYQTVASHSEQEAVFFEVLDLTHVCRATPFLGSSRTASVRTILPWMSNS